MTTAVGPAELAETHSSRTPLTAHVAILLVGATSGLQVAGVATTTLSIVCLALVPGFLLMRHRGADLLPLVLAALGWAAHLASCLLNGVDVLWPNALVPAAFSLYFMGLTVLSDRSIDRVSFLLAGIGAGTVVFFLTEGIERTSTGNFLDVWKYGIAHGVTVVVVFGLVQGGVRWWVTTAVLTVVGVGSLALNFRAHALVCVVAAAILLARRVFGARVRRGWQFTAVIAFGMVFAQVMPVAARAGIFGAVLQRKTLQQDGTGLPLLLGGRTEPPLTLTAIAERPLLGWGSGMNLTTEVYTRAQHLAVDMGFSPTFPFELYWRLPAFDYSAMHSILLGSWAEGGLPAALLPAWLLYVCVVVVWRNDEFGRWSPIVLIVALQGIWDMLYSPWTYNTIAEYACVAILFGILRARSVPS